MANVTVEFLGGLDVVVQKQRVHKLHLPAEVVSVGDLIEYIASTLIKNPRDVAVFLEDGGVRPGIITLINDTDWELEGQTEYVLEDNDVVSFTSTLHGG
ncbi:ubiquitin-related modifier URM1 KNAG_0L00900 [Huiozyma naganishii CBS 8797]|uniref:Ubiquitin-related modifier 1 n=1 Tax=Huiozyma naganishii (strain ATCC MYA-139 / BCRC 22969 / CBS 8797 / KCTC 17520 / NBRC 10181 / NCYC 3082 / Yp74L-3) TaxID=1071383 RepID=J7SB37_HUIN7|nr:hypothetical protein KNAG_0L00900 [Kazachstania naganishii CBS 8797]CCK72711.1 hypothetical protein KNAG_0L00900 [Kazachstania naganishii CBS 8797]